MGKITLFIVLLIIIIVFPVIEMGNYKQKKQYKIKHYVPTVLHYGKYYIYNKKLEKEGNFSVLNVYSKNRLVADNFTLRDLVKKSFLKSEIVWYTAPVLKGRNVYYQTDEYNLSTVLAIYNDKTKILNGEKFKFYGKTFRGYGNKFKVDEKNNIYADNIEYFLKVKK
ncbi:hypothetical protein [Caminibacter sp.]